MKKQIIIHGNQGHMMGMNYFRSIPRQELKMIGSFFLLDHFFERELSPVQAEQLSAIGAHPHRGITTLTYMMQGENEHTDSIGNKAMVRTGGVQWMKSGRGIVHDEGAPESYKQSGGLFHLLQFWLVLSPAQRDDLPDYHPLLSEDVPEKVLDIEGSKIRVLLGEYCDMTSPLPTDGVQFLYHVSISPDASFYYSMPSDSELGVFAAKGNLSVDNVNIEQSSLLFCNEEGRTLHLSNTGEETVDVLLMGGAPYEGEIYADGPFVMGDREGIQKAYDDFYAGKYGTINNNN